jgi:hypothetical protein
MKVKVKLSLSLTKYHTMKTDSNTNILPFGASFNEQVRNYQSRRLTS